MATPPVSDPSSYRVASTVDLLAVLWRRRRITMSCLALSLAAAAVLYVVSPPTYESETAVLLVQKNPQPVTRDARFESGFDAFLATHRALIVSPLIVERAIEAADLKSLKMFRELDPDEELVDFIIGSLEAGNAGRELGENADSILTLTFLGTDPDECPRVVEAILASYRSFLDESYRGLSDDVLRLIARAQELLEEKLKQQEDAYITFRQESPLVAKGLDEVNPLQERLAAIDARRSELMLAEARLQAQLVTLKNAMQGGADQSEVVSLIADLRRQFEDDTTQISTASGLDSQLIQLTDREQQLLALFGPKHPHVTTVRKRIANVRKLQALPTATHAVDLEADGTVSGAAVGDLYIRHLKQSLESIQASERLLSALYDREHATAKTLSSFQLRDERFQRDITRTQQLYDEVISKLQEASLVKGIGGYEAKVIARPRIGKKVGPSLKLFGLGSVLLGLFLGCTLAVGWELGERVSRSQAAVNTN